MRLATTGRDTVEAGLAHEPSPFPGTATPAAMTRATKVHTLTSTDPSASAAMTTADARRVVISGSFGVSSRLGATWRHIERCHAVDLAEVPPKRRLRR